MSLIDHNSLTVIKTVSLGEQINIANIDLDHLGSIRLNLKRLKLYADGARVTIHGEHGTHYEPMPNNIYFVGEVQNLSNSQVFISFLENGDVEGVLDMSDGTKYTLEWQKQNQFKLNKPNTEDITRTDSRNYNPKDFIELPKSEVLAQRSQTNQPHGSAIDYELTVAIETDHEFYRIFNSTSAEINYISGLIGYLSSMYYNEINTSVLLGNITI